MSTTVNGSGGRGIPEHNGSLEAYLCLEDVQVSMDSYMQDFQTHLLPAIKPGWAGVELDSKVFDSGITNKLVAIFNRRKGLKSSREDVVLIRINGVGTDKFISRTDELVCILALNRVGLSPPVYARLRNGLCYGYIPGRQLAVGEVREEGMSRKIARLMARLHCVEIPRHFQGRRPQVWAKVREGGRDD